jgi:cyclase
VPVVASGGAHTPEDLVAAFGAGATAALIASILHDGGTTVQELKVEMERHGLEVRR